MPSPLAVVFDFDGLLVDTTACWHRAFATALARSGRRLDPATAARLNGASVEAAADQLRVAADDVRHGLREAFSESALPLLPGAQAVVTQLAERMPLAVATNGPGDLVKAALRRTGLLDRFTMVLSAEPPRKAKPAPDVYAAACQALGVRPGRAIALEDSPVGILAARRAGLTVIQVSTDREAAVTADLHVSRLDDPRVLELAGMTAP
jgi:HAD superfamily hydrolase (TIGR01509 family)